MRASSAWRYDFDKASDEYALRDMIAYIDRHGYILISVTQNTAGVYTVFFRRPVP